VRVFEGGRPSARFPHPSPLQREREKAQALAKSLKLGLAGCQPAPCWFVGKALFPARSVLMSGQSHALAKEGATMAMPLEGIRIIDWTIFQQGRCPP